MPPQRLLKCFIGAVALCFGVWAGAQAQDSEQSAAAGLGLIVDIKGAIGPASARHLGDALQEAALRNAEIVIMRMDTPGGLVTSMREMIRDILGSRVPVIGFVAPPGAHAASAGTYLLYATNIAAMAPGTNVGAATPIQIGGFPGLPSPEEPKDKKPTSDQRGDEGKSEDGKGKDSGEKPAGEAAPQDAAKAKAVNDAVAFIRSLAELRGRNAEWAERAVRQAASLSAKQALELGVINILANDIQDLLDQLDGRSVIISGKEQTLSTKNLRIEVFEPSFMTRLLGQLANPNVAFILMLIGVYGLIFEFANPGSIGPGVIGAICLVLGLYALNQLPLDYAGLALLLLGLGFMVAEAFTPTFGVLGIGGLIAFVIGAAFLIDTDVPAYQLSWSVIAATAALSGLLLTLLLGYVWRSQRRAVVTGAEHMVGDIAEVIDWADGEGHVWTAGERWQARGEGSFEPGQKVRIDRLDGLTLIVSPATGAGEHKS